MHKEQQLDPVSREFIDWSRSYLSGNVLYFVFIFSCFIRFVKFFVTTSPETVRAALTIKFYAGGMEHGNPVKYTAADIQRELEMEYLDALGWPLVGKFNEAKKK